MSVTVERSTDGLTWAGAAILAGDATSYNDTGVEAQTAYQYRVRSANGNGVSPYSEIASVATPGKPPATPTGLIAAAASPTEIDLSWVDESVDELGFAVERSDDGTTWTVIEAALEPDTTTYADIDVLEGTTYRYRVAATGDNGISWSDVASATTPWSTPAAPAVLGAAASSPTRIDLTWSDGARNEAGFVLERSTLADFSTATTIALPANTTTYSDTAVVERTTYHYRVKAVNAGGDSAWSNAASATTPGTPPSAPGDLSATASSSSQIDLSWVDTATTETGFVLERSRDGTTWEILAGALPPDTTSYRDTGLTEGTAYQYRVSTVNEFGSSATSGVATATTSIDPPTAPTGIAAVAVSPTRIDVTWTDASSNETGFTLERSTSSTFSGATTTALPAGATSYSDIGLTEATAYYYRVRSRNGGGASGWAVSGQVTTPLSLPSAPQSATATAVSPTRIDVGWVDAAMNEAGYRVERSIDGTNWIEIANPPANATGYSDTTVVERTTYQYRVRTFNASGTSGWSNTASATTPATPPNAPVALTATQVSLTRINLTWTDTSTNETGFVLERSSDGTTWTILGGTLAANTTTYSDIGLADGVHWYRVKATRFGVSSAYAVPARGSRVKDMTFEGSSLTGAYGASGVIGAPAIALSTTGPIRGTASARIPLGTTAAYLEEPFASATDVFVSFYVRVTSRGASDVQLLQIVHGTGPSAITAGNIVMHANGKLNLRNNTTIIGAVTAGLKTGTIYRVGLHQKVLGGGKLQLDAYLVEGAAAFGSAFATTTTATIPATIGDGVVRVGTTTGGALDATIDEVSVDLAFMPPPR